MGNAVLLQHCHISVFFMWLQCCSGLLQTELRFTHTELQSNVQPSQQVLLNPPPGQLLALFTLATVLIVTVQTPLRSTAQSPPQRAGSLMITVRSNAFQLTATESEALNLVEAFYREASLYYKCGEPLKRQGHCINTAATEQALWGRTSARKQGATKQQVPEQNYKGANNENGWMLLKRLCLIKSWVAPGKNILPITSFLYFQRKMF